MTPESVIGLEANFFQFVSKQATAMAIQTIARAKGDPNCQVADETVSGLRRVSIQKGWANYLNLAFSPDEDLIRCSAYAGVTTYQRTSRGLSLSIVGPDVLGMPSHQISVSIPSSAGNGFFFTESTVVSQVPVLLDYRAKTGSDSLTFSLTQARPFSHYNSRPPSHFPLLPDDLGCFFPDGRIVELPNLLAAIINPPTENGDQLISQVAQGEIRLPSFAEREESHHMVLTLYQPGSSANNFSGRAYPMAEDPRSWFIMAKFCQAGVPFSRFLEATVVDDSLQVVEKEAGDGLILKISVQVNSHRIDVSLPVITQRWLAGIANDSFMLVDSLKREVMDKFSLGYYRADILKVALSMFMGFDFPVNPAR